jgi:hypothetical protein
MTQLFLNEPLGHEISVDRMSYKDTNTKQTQNRRDRFHHFDAPLFYYRDV